MPPIYREPIRWTVEQLAEAKQVSEEIFCNRRKVEGRAVYLQAFEQVSGRIESTFALTDSLTKIDAALLVEHNQLWQVLRYFCGPQISEEDFWTLVGKKFTRVPAPYAETAAAVLNSLLDSHRLPWVAEGRKPTKAEKCAAILATATLLAHEKHRTGRRGLSAKSQEDVVADLLLSAELAEIVASDRRPIQMVDDLPRGSFSREQKIYGVKCDVPCRLFDGRILALECKVSNGPKNGWKRLLREVGGKADTWKQSFGNQLTTGAVITGVFDLSCLKRAQSEHHIALFWQHDLSSLKSFVESTKSAE